PIAGAGARAVGRKVLPGVSSKAGAATTAVKNTTTKGRAKIQPLGANTAAVKADKVYKTLDRRVNTAIENASHSTGKLKENYRQEAVELIRLRNARVAELTNSQGGYINPGAMADDA